MKKLEAIIVDGFRRLGYFLVRVTFVEMSYDEFCARRYDDGLIDQSEGSEKEKLTPPSKITDLDLELASRIEEDVRATRETTDKKASVLLTVTSILLTLTLVSFNQALDVVNLSLATILLLASTVALFSTFLLLFHYYGVNVVGAPSVDQKFLNNSAEDRRREVFADAIANAEFNRGSNRFHVDVCRAAQRTLLTALFIVFLSGWTVFSARMFSSSIDDARKLIIELPPGAKVSDLFGTGNSANSPPASQLPVKQPPTKQPPTEQPPTKQPPTKQPPTKQSPTKQSPTKQSPTKQSPTKQPPTKQPPTKQQPSAKQPRQ